MSSVNPVVMRYIKFHFPLLQKQNVLPGKDFVSRGTTKKLENARKEWKYSGNWKVIVAQMAAEDGALKKKAEQDVSLVRLLIKVNWASVGNYICDWK